MEELKKTIYKINKNTLTEMSTLDKSKVYVFEVKVPDNCPVDKIESLCKNMCAQLQQLGLKFLVIPHYGESNIKITELEKYEENE